MTKKIKALQSNAYQTYYLLPTTYYLSGWGHPDLQATYYLIFDGGQK